MNELIQVAAIVTAAGVCLVALKKVFVFTKKTIYLIDEVVGDDESGRVGVIKRVTIIEGELTTGQGDTLRDQVDSLREWTKEHEEEFKHTRRNRRDY